MSSMKRNAVPAALEALGSDMSYYCNMSVVRASSELDAFHKAQQVISFLKTEAGYKWYIDESIYYMARVIRHIAKDRDVHISDCMLVAPKHFTIEFVYYPKLKLLGCTNPVFRKVFTKAKELCFQNSCDQDYYRKEWKNIRFLTDIYDKWMNTSDEVIVSDESWYADEDTDIDNHLDYQRRTLAYEEIESLMGIDDYLYGRDNPNFIRFGMTPLDNDAISFDVAKAVRAKYLSDKDYSIY